jgi:hypothetical protein
VAVPQVSLSFAVPGKPFPASLRSIGRELLAGAVQKSMYAKTKPARRRVFRKKISMD